MQFISKLSNEEKIYLESLILTIRKEIRNVQEISDNNPSIKKYLKNNILDTHMIDDILDDIDEDKSFYHARCNKQNEIKRYADYNNIPNCISSDSISNMSYDELCDFLLLINYLINITEDSNIMHDEYLKVKRLIKYKEDLITKNVIELHEMDLEDFKIFFKFLRGNSKDWYASSCGVDEDELTPEILYKKYGRR